MYSIANMATLLGMKTVVVGIYLDVTMSIARFGMSRKGHFLAMELEDGQSILRGLELQRNKLRVTQ